MANSDSTIQWKDDNEEWTTFEQEVQARYHVARDVYFSSYGRYSIDWRNPDISLGSGAFGSVYKAKNTTTGEELAIKRIHDYILRKSLLTQRVLREMKVLAHVSHPMLVGIKDMLFSSQTHSSYIITELMSHELGALLGPGKFVDFQFEADHYQYFAHQILLGTFYLHQAGVLHRDLKPANLLVNDDCKLKICDFGLAKSLEDPDRTQYVVTRWYRAPEIILGMMYGVASDLWSIGCILFELVNEGTPLFPLPSGRGPGGPKAQLNQIFQISPAPAQDSPWWDMLAKQTTPTIAEYVRGIAKAVRPANGVTRLLFKPECQKHVDDGLLQLLNGLLVFDSTKRMTADEALHSAYIAGYFSDQSEEYLAALNAPKFYEGYTPPSNSATEHLVDTMRRFIEDFQSAHERVPDRSFSTCMAPPPPLEEATTRMIAEDLMTLDEDFPPLQPSASQTAAAPQVQQTAAIDIPQHQDQAVSSSPATVAMVGSTASSSSTGTGTPLASEVGVAETPLTPLQTPVFGEADVAAMTDDFE